MRTIAVIPAKSRSTRVPNKNFRDFYNGKSLLELKINQCVHSGAFDEIYVSSDDPVAEQISRTLKVNFSPRDSYLCQDKTPWGDVLEGILNGLPVDSETYIAWCPVTSPLFSRYKDVVQKLEQNTANDSVVTVTPLTHYFLNSDLMPINHQWGPWHSYSQGMKPIYQMNLACLLAQKATIIRNQYQIGNRPVFWKHQPLKEWI
ncbi:cytidylyltransferase domain-containing protein [Azotobacter sp. CWF10]